MNKSIFVKKFLRNVEEVSDASEKSGFEEFFENKFKEKVKLDSVREKIKSALVPGEDYMSFETVNPSTGQIENNTFLTKVGAMRLCQWLGFADNYEVSSRTVMVRGVENVIYEVRCKLYDEEGGLVGEGFGSASSLAFRSTNMAIKMARKSALVDAVVYALGLEFSPDEDYQKYTEYVPESSVDEKGASTPKEHRATSDMIEQIKKGCLDLGIPLVQVRDHYGVQDIAELTLEQAQEMLAYIEGLKSRSEAAHAQASEGERVTQ